MNLYEQLVTDPRFMESFKDTKIYGVTGSNGSGKDTLLDMFTESGYLVFNTGDNLRLITTATMGTTQRGGNNSPTGQIANAQRTTYPGGMVTLALIDYWAKILHMPEKLRPKGLAIGSIRSISEAKTLKDFGGILISVDADPRVRYERIISRARSYESKITFEQFINEDKAEMGYQESDPTKFSIAQIMQSADIKLDNSNNDIDQFLKIAKHEIGIK